MRVILLVQQTLLLHTQQVNVLIEKHKELRRKKSANSFRREGVTQVSWKTLLSWTWFHLRGPRRWVGSRPQTGTCPPSAWSRRRRRTARLSDWSKRRWSSSAIWMKKRRRRTKTTLKKLSFYKSLWLMIKWLTEAVIIHWKCAHSFKNEIMGKWSIDNCYVIHR